MKASTTRKQPAARRDRIVTAAMEEFAERGFVSASTNTIAERAGVAKGLLFHHYGDKDALFLACVGKTAAVIDPYFAKVLDDAPPDLFERLMMIIEKKISFVRDEPLASRFLIVALADAPAPLRKKAMAVLDVSAAVLRAKSLQSIDAGRLRPGVRLEEAMESILLLAAGIERRNEALTDTLAKAKAFDVEAAVAHAKRMLSILRDGLYG